MGINDVINEGVQRCALPAAVFFRTTDFYFAGGLSQVAYQSSQRLYVCVAMLTIEVDFAPCSYFVVVQPGLWDFTEFRKQTFVNCYMREVVRTIDWVPQIFLKQNSKLIHRRLSLKPDV